MGYRDEHEALRARIEQLERELSDAHEEAGRLRGASSASTVEEAMRPRGLGQALLGASTSLRLERTVEGEVPAERLPELVDRLRGAFGVVGRIERGGRGLAWVTARSGGGRHVEVTVVPANGRTTIRVTEHLKQLAGGLFGGVLGGAGGGGLGVVIPLTAVIAPLAAPIAGAVWLLGIYGAVRAGFRGTAERRAEQLVRVADDLERACGAAVAGLEAPAARVRVQDREDEIVQAFREEAERAARRTAKDD